MFYPQIQSAADAQSFVMAGEEAFRSSLADAVEKIVHRNHRRVLTVSGPSCSGKTTASTRLMEALRENGDVTVLISIDDFFRDRPAKKTDTAALDYDSVNAIDLDCLTAVIEGICKGKKVLLPHYDFTTGKRNAYTEYCPMERNIHIFEGIQAVYPEVTSVLHTASAPYGGFDSVFICPDAPDDAENTILSDNDIRLLRRIVRDVRTRGASPEFTLRLWDSVRANEEENILPYAKNATVRINSYLPYELFVIAPLCRPYLAAIPQDSRYYNKAQALLTCLDAFDSPFFSSRMVPSDSVFREFIGDIQG
ncbi:MAG: hypothetical protein SOZ09_08330 [Eubacteriales bacterium]|nr:hypothetical protein [Clostridiales bacterium]MDD7773510.1 hypothetical protein [Eubacteriales bacterium]MDY3941977.1 hypothetical protein [Eubacteriales bacterium]